MEKPNLCSTSAVDEIFQFDFVALDCVSTSNSQNSEKKGKKKPNNMELVKKPHRTDKTYYFCNCLILSVQNSVSPGEVRAFH